MPSLHDRILGAAAGFVFTLCTANPAAARVVNPITNQLWYANGATVTRVDLGTYAQQSATIPANAQLVRLDPIRNFVYVQHQNGAVTRVDGRTLAVTPVVASGGGPGLALDPERNRIWASGSGGSVLAIDGADLSVQVIPMPAGTAAPQLLVVDPTSGLAYTGGFTRPPELVPLGLVIAHQLSADPPAVEDTFELWTSPVDLEHVGLAVELASGDTVSQLMDSGASAAGSVRADWSTGSAQLGGNWGDAPIVIEPPSGRIWTTTADRECGLVRAFAASSLTLVPGTTHGVCFDSNAHLTVNPATARAYFGGPGLTLIEFLLDIFDPATPAITTIPHGDFTGGALLGVNVATNRIYYTLNGTLTELAEPVTAPVPITVAITPGAPAPNGSIPVSFQATTGWPFPIRNVYWQVDAIDGSWTAATPSGANGCATISGLAQGTHTLHAFATDGQEATLANGRGQPVVVGPVASVEISVPAPAACANGVDDDGDGATDYPADAGCWSASAVIENPQCDNGLDDDGDLATDHPADTRCRGRWDNNEATDPASCGLGAELVLLGAVARWLARRIPRA